MYHLNKETSMNNHLKSEFVEAVKAAEENNEQLSEMKEDKESERKEKVSERIRQIIKGGYKTIEIEDES